MKCIDMYSNKSYFIFGFGARIIMKLEQILGLLKKEICLVWIFVFFMGQQPI